ncbi:hypothetical protein VTK73DRAFT_2838 [Phialemonium thermophilum]|uniref:Endonuclease III-like protein n=1 Tax=Phialemonium thermophilum TaxID=223376 RepID=A0ABR3X2A6_9PEZI
MVQTRSQGHKRPATPRESSSHGETPDKKSKAESGNKSPEKHPDPSVAPSRANKSKPDMDQRGNGLKKKITSVVDKYGQLPLHSQVDDRWPASSIVMAHILNALLSSARISHNIAAKTVSCLLDEGYHDVETLGRDTWEQKTRVLRRGGYVRYDEKTATYLEELVSLIKDTYDGDASRILPQDKKGDEARRTVSDRLKDIKGLGPMGIELFLGSIQHYFPAVAPFLDSRSRKTAAEIGLGHDLDAIFGAVDQDATAMAKLEVALTRVRLEKRESEFT